MKNWTVKLTKSPKPNCYPNNYFPRDFHYKKDALALKEEVEKKGGKAEVEKYLTEVQKAYEKAECPDCGTPIPKSAVNGSNCKNCGHVFWDSIH